MSRRDIESVPYRADTRPEKLIENGHRISGRSFEEFRNVFLKTGVISQASGSAYIEFGPTKVMVAVYGPRQSDRRSTFSDEGKLNVDIKYAAFATRERRTVLRQSPEEKEMCSIMQTALEPAIRFETFPKTVLDVYCTILEAGGSELAAAITAASAAVADAGVEMNDLVTACEVSKVQGALVLDPSSDEVYREYGGLLLATKSTNNQVTQLIARGRWSDGELKESLELALGGCVQLDGAVRQCLVDSV